MKFVQDGARSHIDHHVMKYLVSKKVNTVPDWPARSPDLNPIEVMWARIQRLVDKHAPTDKEELKNFWQKEWELIPQSEVDKLVMSFTDRLKACIINKGATLGGQWRKLLPNPAQL